MKPDLINFKHRNPISNDVIQSLARFIDEALAIRGNILKCYGDPEIIDRPHPLLLIILEKINLRITRCRPIMQMSATEAEILIRRMRLVLGKGIGELRLDRSDQANDAVLQLLILRKLLLSQSWLKTYMFEEQADNLSVVDMIAETDMKKSSLIKLRRDHLENWIEDAIEILDQLDGDPDFENEMIDDDEVMD